MGVGESVSGPVRLRGLTAAACVFHFLQNPLRAMRRIDRRWGRFVQLGDFPPPVGARRQILFAVGGAFNREVLGAPAVWRTVNIALQGPRGSAMRRLWHGIVRMGGERHAHYRRLLVPPLRRANVDALGDAMAALAGEEVERWPVGEPIDLWAQARRLMRRFAIGLLFGDDRRNGYAVADGIAALLEFNYSLKVGACPVDLPFTPYGRMLRRSERLERMILAWANQKRGALDPSDLLSIVVNNPDEAGRAPSDEIIAGHVPTLFGAAYETCQNVLIWTLILLAEHAGVARDLYDEIKGALGSGAPTLDGIAGLPLLDAVVKESMRLLPPVPVQMRVATQPTALRGHPVARDGRVVLSPFLTNRLPGFFPEPDRFDPGRWATIEPSPFDYAAFSGGPRSCPGFAFGTSVVKMALASILVRYRVAIPTGTRIDYQVRIALSPRGRVPAVLHPADGNFAQAAFGGTIRELVAAPLRDG
jgi:cytochrome P450